ncbi:MAG TPA: glycosyltransferase family 39 protein [Candidatus Nanoarchaeia archaeon]|nr:glycosyltransferase family 39 protein [Candidatus Nanoarchaeia archaeon]
MKKNVPLLIIIAFALLLRLFFAFSWHEVWWDSGVYIGMGKYIFSGGESGLWEHIRPPFVPFVLGLFWSLGLDPVLFGRLFSILLSCGVVLLVYLIARHWFDEQTALLASLIVALSPVVFYLGFHQYTEIPSTFFSLLAVYLFVRGRFFLSGLSAGLAFLAKFNAGIFVALLLIVALTEKKFKPALLVASGFSIFSIPYFAWSWLVYGSPFATLIAASDAIKRVLGCNVIHGREWWHYFWWLVFSETKLHFVAIIGFFILLKNWSRKWLLFVLCLAIPLFYHMQLSCRDYRYLTLFLPFVAMLTALGHIPFKMPKFLEKPEIKKAIIIIVFIALGAWMLHTTLLFYFGNERQVPNPVEEEYFAFLEDKPSGEVWTSNPIIAAHTDAKLEKIYYPIFDEGLLHDFYDYASLHSERISYVFLDNCGGGIMCAIGQNCNTDQLQVLLDSKFKRAFDKQSGNCWYRIWVKV